MLATIIHSNGSKWGGQQPDSIETLIDRLNNYTIDSMFFSKFQRGYGKDKKKYVLCPISKVEGKYLFFGNFEEISGVFRIETSDPKVIKKLKCAIIQNKGWIKYIGKCKAIAHI